MEATEVKGKLILQCLVYIPILQGQPPQVTPFYPISNEPKVERCWAFILPLNVWTHSRSLFLLSLISGIQYSLSFCMKSLSSPHCFPLPWYWNFVRSYDYFLVQFYLVETVFLSSGCVLGVWVSEFNVLREIYWLVFVYYYYDLK